MDNVQEVIAHNIKVWARRLQVTAPEVTHQDVLLRHQRAVSKCPEKTTALGMVLEPLITELVALDAASVMDIAQMLAASSYDAKIGNVIPGYDITDHLEPRVRTWRAALEKRQVIAPMALLMQLQPLTDRIAAIQLSK